MATSSPTQPNDPAKLGADRSPETSREDDAHDMSSVLAEDNKDQSPDTPEHPGGPALGSAFEHQRQQGASFGAAANGGVTQAEGQGRAGYNGDEDRGYESTHRGGLGSSGGREHHTTPPADNNPFTGNADDQPSTEKTKDLGLNTPTPTNKPE